MIREYIHPFLFMLTLLLLHCAEVQCGVFVNSAGMRFVLIQPGTFMMGSPESESGRDMDERLHEVTISEPFFMQTTEVTQDQWKRVMGKNPAYFKGCGDNCPVEGVSWNNAQEFIRRLNKMEGADRYRLPTETEWEYSARAGTKTPFHYGSSLSSEQANFNGGYPYGGAAKGVYREKTVPVASFQPNVWGLYDMHGNVWEWCQDWYDKDYYKRSPKRDPKGPDSGSSRVLRGGSWCDAASFFRSAYRWGRAPISADPKRGFRCAAQGKMVLSVARRKELERLKRLEAAAEQAKKKEAAEIARREKEREEARRRAEIDGFVNSAGMRFVLIQPGTFMMGSPESESGRDMDERLHEVTISEPFFMQTTEVTQDQWKRVMGKNPSRFEKCGDNCPVEGVSWNNAQEFIRRLNKMEGADRYRFPTETEWEYSARAGTKTPFHYGSSLSSEQANFNGGYPYGGAAKGMYREKTVPVASFQPNVWGLYDMHGNVWEWCQDWYGDYPSGQVTDPKGPGSGSSRVLRGGSWKGLRGGSSRVLRGGAWYLNADYCRSAVRYGSGPGNSDCGRGVRCAAKCLLDITQ